MVNGDTAHRLAERKIWLHQVLKDKDNDAYHALKRVDGLIVTGPTRTNVNDMPVALIRPNRPE